MDWHHDLADEPVMIYSEVESGRETRKIEVYRDGHTDVADPTTSSGTAMLAEGLMPTVDEISSDDAFTATEISADQFNEIWSRATSR